MDLRDALRRTLLAPTPLLEKGDTVLVAVSGGPDSLSLLHALHALRDEISLAGLFAAHFHHGLRGADADGDAAFVEAFCRERGIAFEKGRADVAALAARTGVSIQQAARTARYGFLAQAAQRLGAAKIATGHTQDDQVETVLMNVLRGAGLEGLRGIPARREKYVRPLLAVSRAEVEAYCAAHGLLPRQDGSNVDASHYTRNRVRLELLPLLERDFAPGVREALLRLSRIADADADYLDAQAREAVTGATLNRDKSCHTLSVPKLAALHPALLRTVLRTALSDLRGSREGMTFDHVERLCEAVSAPGGPPFALTLPAPLCRAQVKRQTLTLSLAQAPANWADVRAQLSVSTAAALPVIGWTVYMRFENEMAGPTDALRAVLDADKVDAASLIARAWVTRDRIAPLGMSGHSKKVGDIFTDAKIPQPDRHKTPIVADKDGLLWVAGLVVCERARVTDATTRRLHLIAVPLPRE